MSGGAYQTMLLHHLGSTCKTIEVLSKELGLSRRQISDAASALIRRDYVERAERGCFQLTEAGQGAVQRGEQITSGPNSTLKTTRRAVSHSLRQRAWSAMRIHRRFTIGDILTAATTGTEARAENNLQRYVKALCRAGVLRRLPRRQPGSRPTSNGFSQYTLVRDLGHVAPSYRAKDKALFDHNSGEELAL